ncbi:MAG: hypothetical protein P8Y54_13280 [Xanthomonadales bacterium]
MVDPPAPKHKSESDINWAISGVSVSNSIKPDASYLFLRKLWTILAVLVAGVALYTLAGFLLAPQFGKRWIETAITADSGGRLEAEHIAFNPYTFEVSFNNLTLYDRENKLAFSIRQAAATLDLQSLRERYPIFDGAVELTGCRRTRDAPGAQQRG